MPDRPRSRSSAPASPAWPARTRCATSPRSTVVDRIPVPGGVHGWEAAETARAGAEACGARMQLGETAIRWDGRSCWRSGRTARSDRIAAALVIATGTRPLGRAELGIAGGRPAGIVAATVACHLAENGLLVGRRPLIVGGGDWAMRAASELLRGRCRAGHPGLPGRAAARTARPDDAGARARARPRRVGRGHAAGAHGHARLRRDAGVRRGGAGPRAGRRCATWTAPSGTGRRTVYAQPLADPTTVEQARRPPAEAAAAVRSLIDAGGASMKVRIANRRPAVRRARRFAATTGTWWWRASSAPGGRGSRSAPRTCRCWLARSAAR